MATAEDLLALLRGRKVFDGTTWRVFDQNGNELTDSGGVLWRGVHGFLLNQQLLIDNIVVEQGGVLKATIWDSVTQTKEQLLHRDRLLEEDQIAAEFILTLLTSGFLNG